MNTQAKITAIVARLAERQADIVRDQWRFESGLLDSFTFDSITRIQDYLESRTVA
jgi:hypothetical protein